MKVRTKDKNLYALFSFTKGDFILFISCVIKDVKS